MCVCVCVCVWLLLTPSGLPLQQETTHNFMEMPQCVFDRYVNELCV